MSINTVVLTGNLGNDPETFYSAEKGTNIVSFNMAFRLNRDKSGWVKVTCFNKLAETCEKYLHKGARIAITGSLDYHQWEDDKGTKRSTLQLIGNSIEFIKVDRRDSFQEEQQEVEAAA